MNNWSIYRDDFYQNTLKFGSEPSVFCSTPSGSVVVLHSKFSAFNGEGNEQPYASLAMCTGGGGRTRKQGDGVFLDDFWQPGKLGFSMPTKAAPEGFTPEMETLAIAFNPYDIPFCHSEGFDVCTLNKLAHSLFQDELISAVMFALLRDAEAHGTASAFFEHGLSLIINRLKKHANSHTKQTEKAITQKHSTALNEVLAFIEQQLDQDIKVKELAGLANLSARSFTRQFKQSTGYTPFMYLTKQRMARAQLLLRDGSSVTETAIAVGYANPAKFAAAFRRWLGQSPSNWQKQQLSSF